ncbi:unnamed protein product [Lactuca saligna]|uniref:Rx N-terminal domain-containing protein n=1 Tax=Lactuca saligna TaxID=75948 RepID=A0AA35VIF5_LACSI|nr:unnamed protein product [Lactuca saligna]
MAEIVVSAVITVLCEKLISGDLMKLARSEGIDSELKKWKKNLPMIQAVLADATQKQIKERAVQLWVNDLQHLAYDIDDVLDDLATEALRRKLNQEAQASSSSSKVLKLVPNCCTNFTPRNIMYGQQMSSKLEEITTKLHDLVDQRNDLGLNVNVERSNITERRLEQTSLVDESKIMGRDGDKEALLGKLLGNEECDENVSIVSIVGEFSFRLDGEVDASDMNEAFDKFRHFSLVGPRSGSYRKLNELQRAKHLRTFLVMSGNLKHDGLLEKVLLELQFLRVLSVAGLNRMYLGFQKIRKVPESIGSLKHLRYLNFSFTEITCLPEEVSGLYNLQSLLVHSCHELYILPESFAKLINLRHLDISDTPKLNKTPLGLGGLTNLQTLPKVFIEEGDGFNISDLKGLNDLQGRLSIIRLDKVINPIQAKDANLHQKKGLEVLEMKWSKVFDDSRNETIEYEVLKELRPPPKLKNLRILYNKGTRFPSWVGDPSFEQLTELTLCGCRSTHLRVGHLRSLKKLVVERMNEVKTVGFELPAPTNYFPSLEVLEFSYMQGWQRWSIDSGDDHETPRSFPRLHEISIKCCPVLDEVSIGLIPSLRFLRIEECSEPLLRSLVGLSPSLIELKMLNVRGLTQLHGEVLMHLRALECLCIKNCDELKYLWEQESEACKSLVSLQKLEVWWCKNLVSSPEKEDNFGISMESLKSVEFHNCDALESYNCPNSVERLEITNCDSMTSLTFSAVQEHPSPLTELIISDCDNIQLHPKPIPAKDFSLSRLTSLDIRDCKNLKSIPYEHFQSLTSLGYLWLEYCPSMDYSFPCGVWPPNLTKLMIGCLNKPMSEWGPQSFPTSLVELELYGYDSGVVSFAVAEDVKNTTTTPSSSSSFLLPPSLVSLRLIDHLQPIKCDNICVQVEKAHVGSRLST